MAEEIDQQFDDAISRQVAVVIGCRAAGQVHHLTSRFLGRQPAGIWVEMPTTDLPLVDQLLESKAPVAVTYKSGEQRLSFVASLVSRDRAAIPGAAGPVDALLLQRAVDVPSAQRRKHFRVPVGASRLTGKLWQIEDHVYFRDRPLASQRLNLKLMDLSVGGLGVIVESATPVPANQRLRIELKYDDVELLMEGVVRHTTPLKKNSARVGIQFRKLENDVTGRQAIAALTKIVNDIQRLEVRRAREAAEAIPPAAA